MPQQTQSLKIQALRISPELSDAHCHLNLFHRPLDIISNARNVGIGVIVTAGGSAKDNSENADLAGVAQGVFAVVGISPDFSESEQNQLEELADFVKNNEKVVGIGEIGLDAKSHADIGVQRKMFDAQLDLAKDLDVPVVIHSRGFLDEISGMLAEKGIRKALFHFFEGDENQAKALAERGHLISIPPVETSRRKRVIKSTSINNIVAETDSPVVGKDPTDVVKVCGTIASLKRMSVEDVAYATTENIRRLFYI